jgi:hypothetical protein
MDLSTLSNDELIALKSGDLSKISDASLRALSAAPKPEPATVTDKLMASPPARLLKGVGSVIEGGAEMLPYALGGVASGFGLAPNSASKWLFDESKRVREMNKRNEDAYQGARTRTGQSGSDWLRGAGELAAGVGMGLAAPAVPATTLGRAGYGMISGGLTGAVMPTNQPDDAKFAQDKMLQIGGGAALGGVATPLAGKVVDKAGPTIDRMIGKFNARKVTDADVLMSIKTELQQDGIDIGSLSSGVRKSVADQVKAAMKSGEKLDVKAALRKADLDQFGGGTLGQITRDPKQWNREFNLRQIEGAGEPLVDQAQRIRSGMGNTFSKAGADSPSTPYDAGSGLVSGLQNIDDSMRSKITGLYGMARATDGRYAPLNTSHFSKLANDALDEGQLGYALPKEARLLLNKVSKGEIPFDVNTSSQLRSTLTSIGRQEAKLGNNRGSLAVGKVVDALEKTDLLAPQNMGKEALDAFAVARKAAKARFDLLDAVPGLKAASNGIDDPEKFVSKFVTGGTKDASVRNVEKLMDVLPDEGKQVVREQVAKYLQKAAFGENISKDGTIAPERFSKALSTLGREKLSSIFPAETVDSLFTMSRVGSYVHQQPTGITPNRSGTAGALMNLFSTMKGASLAMGPIRKVGQTIDVSRALSPQVPSQPTPVLTPELLKLLGAVPTAGGALALGQ